MLDFLKRLFGSTATSATAPSSDPSAPDYVPVPKAKVPGAMHPLVRANAAKPVRGTARGVGIVYDASGAPKLTKDWLDSLKPADRVAVDANLARRGWRVTPELTVERI